MKKAIILIYVILMSGLAHAQQQVRIPNSAIQEVKIYQSGAMVSRTATATINSGAQELVIDNLSPYISPESITLKGSGNATILSVNFQQNYMKEMKKSPEISALEELYDSLQIKLKLVQNKISTLNETISLLQANKSVGGNNNGVMADELELVVEYFTKKMGNLKDDILDQQQREKKTQEQMNKISNQLNLLRVKQNQPEGNIVVHLNAASKTDLALEFSYVIPGYVSWTPFYDLKAKDVNSPVDVYYKAKVTQQTGEDWKNVKLKLNTANPNMSGTLPQLYPWTIGILEPLKSYYKTYDNAAPAMQAEVLSIAGNAKDDARERGLKSVEVTVNQNQLQSEFEIMSNYTILSNNTEQQIDIQKYSLPATFEYIAIPKLDLDAFLTAKVTNWEQLSLTPGSASVYFDGTFIGETYIDPTATNDTLILSLGRDKRINIKRDKLKEFTSSKLFGNNKEKLSTFEIQVKNTKKEQIKLKIYDQIPMSTDKAIEVELKNSDGGQLNSDNGFITWELDLSPGVTVKKQLSFSVKYPKDKNITGM